MPKITVWGLSPEMPDFEYESLRGDIIRAAIGIEELGFVGESDFLVLFPADNRKKWRSTEIMVQVSELWEKPERTPEIRNRLADALQKVVRRKFLGVRTIAAMVDPLFNPERDGFSIDERPKADKSIDDFLFSNRIEKRLRAEGITTLGQLVAKTEAELLCIEGFGRGSLNEVKSALAQIGSGLGRKEV